MNDITIENKQHWTCFYKYIDGVMCFRIYTKSNFFIFGTNDRERWGNDGIEYIRV